VACDSLLNMDHGLPTVHVPLDRLKHGAEGDTRAVAED